MLRVLLVESDREEAARLERALKETSLRRLLVTRVAEASAAGRIADRTFDVAVLSLSPGEDAGEAARALTMSFPDVPVVTVDGGVGQQDTGCLLECGIQDWLSRRCTRCRGRLTSALEWTVERSRLQRQLKALQEESAHRALHDPLTGLPNRHLLDERLSQLLLQARRHHRRFAVLFLDLDRFKRINDTLGHEVGDAVLEEVARRLQACVRASDTVARRGGDELVVLLGEIRSERAAELVARKLLQEVARPMKIDGHELTCRTSIGISLFPTDGIDARDLLDHADVAMYRAKAGGGNRYRFYGRESDRSTLRRTRASP